MKKRRGSALVYVIIVVFSITSVVIVGAKMSSASENEFQNTLQEAQFKAKADGAVAESISDAYKLTLATGSRTIAYTNGNVTAVTANHPTIDRAYTLRVTGTIGDNTFDTTRVIGKRQRPNPAYYGLWVKDNYSDALLTTSVNGSVYFDGNATITGGWNVTEDLLARGTSTLSLGSTVAGSYLTSVRAQTMPTYTDTTYQGQASVTIAANNQGGITFAGSDAQGKYPVHYRNGNFTMNGGTISGKGTLFVRGNLTVNGNYNYADANSRILIIATGRITVNLLATQLVGTYFTIDNINLNPVTLNVLRGNLCSGKQFNRLATALTITQENAFVESEDERVKHRLPGYFP